MRAKLVFSKVVDVLGQLRMYVIFILNILRKSLRFQTFANYTGQTILKAILATDGLSATTFLVYTPDRSNLFLVDLVGSSRFSSSILLTKLPSDTYNETISVVYKHSGYGSGERVCNLMFKFYWGPHEGDTDGDGEGDTTDASKKIFFDLYKPDISIFKACCAICLSLY
jgi:hypothetical protein